MKIEKILNNNVVVIRDEKGLEKVLMGCGLAYQKKSGDAVDMDKVDKAFYISNPTVNDHFQALIVDIPLEYLELAEHIINYIKTSLGRSLNDTIYISLVDHIYTAVERYQQGTIIKNVLLWEIKRFYSDEYALALEALDMIELKTGVRLPDDEAGFIALHIVNSQMDESHAGIYEITEVIQEISTIVKYFFNIEFEEESVAFYRFISHLKFFAQRLVSRSKQEGTYAEDDLFKMIKLKYKNAYACVEKIVKFIGDKYHYTVSNEEQLYLTIHIERVIYKTEK